MNLPVEIIKTGEHALVIIEDDHTVVYDNHT